MIGGCIIIIIIIMYSRTNLAIPFTSR